MTRVDTHIFGYPVDLKSLVAVIAAGIMSLLLAVGHLYMVVGVGIVALAVLWVIHHV